MLGEYFFRVLSVDPFKKQREDLFIVHNKSVFSVLKTDGDFSPGAE